MPRSPPPMTSILIFTKRLAIGPVTFVQASRRLRKARVMDWLKPDEDRLFIVVA